MAWNEPGGKRRDPWQGGGEQPPDLDAMLKRMRDGFGRFGGAGGGGVVLLVLGVLLAWFLIDSMQTIKESERGVVVRFGKFERIMGPGLNFKWPKPIEQVFKVETTRVRSTSDTVRMLTKDENLIIIDFNVQYTVADPKQFVFGVREPEETLRQAAESAVRQIIGSNTMETIISAQRTELVAAAEKALQDMLERYGTGLSVTQLSFPNPKPPEEVKAAFDDAIAAREDKERLQNEADAYAKKIVPEARGQAARVRAEAEGDRSEAVARATGAATRFELLAEQYALAPQVTRKRLLLETMQQVLSDSPKVLVEGQGDKVIYLPLDKLGTSSLAPIMSQPLDVLERTPSTQVVPAVENSRTRNTDRREREGRDR